MNPNTYPKNHRLSDRTRLFEKLNHPFLRIAIASAALNGCGHLRDRIMTNLSGPTVTTETTVTITTTQGCVNKKQESNPPEVIDEPDKPTGPHLLPEYPVHDQIAVIINGDQTEERHHENVKRAIRTLSQKGFKEFYIVASTNLDEFRGLNIHQFEPRKNGLNQLFEILGNENGVEKDDLVFFYTTGHGSEYRGRGCIGLADECIDQEVMIEKLQLLRTRGARGLFVFDQCYSGTMPDAIIESGVEGVAMSPGVKGKQTACQFFAPDFFKNLLENYDANNDGLSEPSEWFQAAMSAYQVGMGVDIAGEYSQSIPELTTANLKEAMHSGKALVVEVRATWCAVCKAYERDLNEVNGRVGEQVKIFKITDDTNPETEALKKTLGVENITAYPVTLIQQPDGSFKQFKGRIDAEALMGELNSVGVESNDQIYEILAQKTKLTRQQLNPFIELGILDANIIGLDTDPKKALAIYAEKYPLGFAQYAQFNSRITVLPEFPQWIEKAYKTLEDRKQTAPAFAFHYFWPYPQLRPKIVKNIKYTVKSTFNSDIYGVLIAHFDLIKNEPWIDEIMLQGIERNAFFGAFFYKTPPSYLKVAFEFDISEERREKFIRAAIKAGVMQGTTRTQSNYRSKMLFAPETYEYPFSQKVIQSALEELATEQSDHFLENFGMFNSIAKNKFDFPLAPIIAKALNTAKNDSYYSKYIITQLSKLKAFGVEGVDKAADIAIQSLLKGGHLDVLIENCYTIKHLPSFLSVMEKVVTEAATSGEYELLRENRDQLLEYAYPQTDDAERYEQTAINNLAQKDAIEALVLASDWNLPKEWGEEIIQISRKELSNLQDWEIDNFSVEHPIAFLKYKKYLNLTNSQLEEFTIKAIEKYKEDNCRGWEYCIHDTWFFELLDPYTEAILDAYASDEYLFGEHGIKQIFRRLGGESALNGSKHLRNYLHKILLRTIIDRKYPEIALGLYEYYKDLPWAEEIIQIISRHISKNDYMRFTVLFGDDPIIVKYLPKSTVN